MGHRVKPIYKYAHAPYSSFIFPMIAMSYIRILTTLNNLELGCFFRKLKPFSQTKLRTPKMNATTRNITNNMRNTSKNSYSHIVEP